MIDTEAIDEIHQQFAFPGVLRRVSSNERDPETGRPRTATDEYDVSIRIDSTQQPREVSDGTGDDVKIDFTIRLSADELDAIDVYPAPDDIIVDARPEPKGGNEYEIMRVLDRQTGVLECDCVKLLGEGGDR